MTRSSTCHISAVKRARRPAAAAPRAPDTERTRAASLRQRNTMLLSENRRLRDENARLRDELAILHGERRQALAR